MGVSPWNQGFTAGHPTKAFVLPLRLCGEPLPHAGQAGSSAAPEGTVSWPPNS